MYTRICYVHFCCKPTPQLQNYLNHRMSTNQKNRNGLFYEMVCMDGVAAMSGGFLVSLHISKRSLLHVNLCILSFTEKTQWAGRGNLNFTTLCQIWLQLLPTCFLPTSAFEALCREGGHRALIPSLTQQWDGFVKVNSTGQHFWVIRATPKKNSHHWQHNSVT